jgi:hypothetical protein
LARYLRDVLPLMPEVHPLHQGEQTPGSTGRDGISEGIDPSGSPEQALKLKGTA